MARKLLRTLLAIATFTVVWLVVSPASALPNRAPVCDPRGATGFAPPPQIQDAEQSFDIPADCAQVDPLESRNVLPGRAQIDLSSSQQEPVAFASARIPVLGSVERVAVDLATAARPPPGARASIERPPQA